MAPIGSLWSEPNYRHSNEAIRAAKKSGLIRHLQILAFSRMKDRLSHTIHLPGLSEKVLRKILRQRPRDVILGSWPLKAKQLAIFQQMIELQFQPEKFDYHFDGDAVLGFKESLKSVRYWRDVDASLRSELRKAAQARRPSREELDNAYQQLSAKIRRAHGASTWLYVDKI